jgi:hypothetical protein
VFGDELGDDSPQTRPAPTDDGVALICLRRSLTTLDDGTQVFLLACSPADQVLGQTTKESRRCRRIVFAVQDAGA